MDKEELLEALDELDEIELHKDDWPLVEALADKGVEFRSFARGPNKEWKRVGKQTP